MIKQMQEVRRMAAALGLRIGHCEDSLGPGPFVLICAATGYHAHGCCCDLAKLQEAIAQVAREIPSGRA